LTPPPIALPLLVPDDLAAVEGTQEDLPHRGGRPAARPPRRGDLVLVERLGDAGEPVALGRQSEDLADHRGLLRVHLADDVLPPAIGSLDLDVIVAVDAAARDVPGPGLSLEGVVGALPRAIALGLVGERRSRS
jgi:hypothetical protein